MAGDKEKKGFSGLLDLASEVSDIYEPIRSEPKEQAIEDGDVKKDSRKATQSTEDSIDPARVQPAQDREVQLDRGETERTETFKAFALLFGFLIGIGLISSIFTSGNNAKSDPVLTSRKTESNPRKSVDDTGNILMDFPTNTSPDFNASRKDLPQKSIGSQGTQGGVVLPDAKGTLIPKESESKALAESGRTEMKPLFSGNERGQARVERVDNGCVVLSDGRRFSIIGLCRSDFSQLMSRYDARSLGFETPLRFIDEERIWWDSSLTYSRKAKFFAKSGTAVILFSLKNNGYFYVDFSKLSSRDRQYIDSIEFSRPLKDDPFNANNDLFNNYHVPDIPFDYEIIPPLYDPLADDFAPASNNLLNDFYTPFSGAPFE